MLPIVLRILDAKGLLLARRGVQDDVWPHYPPYPRRTSNRILANLARYHYHNDDDMVKSGSCLVHPAMTCLLNHINISKTPCFVGAPPPCNAADQPPKRLSLADASLAWG